MRWPRRRRNGKQPLRAPASASATDSRLGTPYVPGMLGRPGWRERGLADPAAILPIDERDRAGVPHSTKSEVVEEPFGMGRRWSTAERSAALFYQLYPEQEAWEPPGGTAPLPDVGGGTTATLPDGRALVFLGRQEAAGRAGDDRNRCERASDAGAHRRESPRGQLIVRSVRRQHHDRCDARDERVVRGDPFLNRPEGSHERQMSGVAQHRVRHEAAGTRCSTAGRGIAHLALQVVIEVFESVRVVEHGQEPRRPREVGALDRHSVQPAVGATNERGRGLLRGRATPFPPAQQAPGQPRGLRLELPLGVRARGRSCPARTGSRGSPTAIPGAADADFSSLTSRPRSARRSRMSVSNFGSAAGDASTRKSSLYRAYVAPDSRDLPIEVTQVERGEHRCDRRSRHDSLAAAVDDPPDRCTRGSSSDAVRSAPIGPVAKGSGRPAIRWCTSIELK